MVDIEVTIFEPTLPLGYRRVARPVERRSGREKARHGLLALGSLALHVLAALVLVVSTGTLELPVRRGATGAFEQGPWEATSLIATFIESATEAPGELVAVAPAPAEWTVLTLAEALPMPALEDLERLSTAEEAATAALGIEESERLRGIYRAQLEARIERAWERPALLEAGLFYRCPVTLVFSSQRPDPEPDFSACEANPELRATLATAIRRALPLPAPPEVLGAVRTLVLEFASSARPDREIFSPPGERFRPPVTELP